MKLLEILELLAFTNSADVDTSMAASAAIGLAMMAKKEENKLEEPEVVKE